MNKTVSMNENEREIWDMIKKDTWTDIKPMSSRFLRLFKTYEWFYHVPMTKENVSLVNVDDMGKLLLAIFDNYRTVVWKKEYLRIWQMVFDKLCPETHSNIVYIAFNKLIIFGEYDNKYDSNGEKISQKIKKFDIIDDKKQKKLKDYLKKKKVNEIEISFEKDLKSEEKMINDSIKKAEDEAEEIEKQKKRKNLGIYMFNLLVTSKGSYKFGCPFCNYSAGTDVQYSEHLKSHYYLNEDTREYSFICKSDGKHFNKCPNNVNGECKFKFLVFPFRLIHMFNGINIINCP